jgi:hypothetical protein
MTYKELKLKIKKEQKELAQKIRTGKSLRKPSNYKKYKGKNKDGLIWDLSWNQNLYRHRHIVYCQMFNNTPYHKIEQPRDENTPCSDWLESIRKKWEAEIDEEALRDCA